MSTVAVMLALGGTGYAATVGIPDSSGVFHGCVSKQTGVLRVVHTSARCRRGRKHGEFAISWNQKGQSAGGTGGGSTGGTSTGSGTASGPAGGDLAGSYPNPSIAPSAVTSSKLAANSVTGAKVAPKSLTGADFACQPGDTGLDGRDLCFFRLSASSGTDWAGAVRMCRARGSTPSVLPTAAEVAAIAENNAPFHSMQVWTSEISSGGPNGNGAWVVQIGASGAVSLFISTPLTASTIVDVLCVYHAADVF